MAVAHQESPPAPDQEIKANTPEETREELRQAIKGSREILVTATTVFPIFPDTISVDRAKFTVTKRTFFKTAEVMSMRIEDILNVTASIGPMFGAVKITSRVMNADPPYSIGLFRRQDAVRIKQVAQGYVIALQRGIDCSALSTTELANMLQKLGQDDHQN